MSVRREEVLPPQLAWVRDLRHCAGPEGQALLEERHGADSGRLVRAACWWALLLVTALALAVVVPVVLRWRPARHAYSVFGRWDCAAWAGNSLFYLCWAGTLASPILLIGLIVAVVRAVRASRAAARSNSQPRDEQQ